MLSTSAWQLRKAAYSFSCNKKKKSTRGLFRFTSSVLFYQRRDFKLSARTPHSTSSPVLRTKYLFRDRHVGMPQKWNDYLQSVLYTMPKRCLVLGMTAKEGCLLFRAIKNRKAPRCLFHFTSSVSFYNNDVISSWVLALLISLPPCHAEVRGIS